MYMNIQGLVTENSRKKVDYIKELTQLKKIMIINITESWLNDEIDKDVMIEGYEMIRSDRKSRKKAE